VSTVYTAGRDGGSPKAITSEHRGIFDLRWSPDGHTIVGRLQVLVSASQTQELILVAPDGSNRRTMRCSSGRVPYFRARLGGPG
jgi:Tol biopolymer transport system component